MPHVRPLRSPLAGINHNTPIVDNYNEDHGIGNYPQIPPPNFTGMQKCDFVSDVSVNSHSWKIHASKQFLAFHGIKFHFNDVS